MNNPLMNWATQGGRLDYFFINSNSSYYDGELSIELPVIKETLEEIIENSKFLLRVIIERILDEQNWLNDTLRYIDENEDREPNQVITARYILDNFENSLRDCYLEDTYRSIHPYFRINKYEIISNNSNYRTGVDNMYNFKPSMVDIIDYNGDKEIKTNRDFWIDMVLDYYDKKVYEKVRNNFSNPKTIKTLIDLKIRPKYDKETMLLFYWDWKDEDYTDFVEVSTTLGSI
tara:strand:+ start:11393 stop:12085 length:693 start_codon:yes stop_codon:yes gene_type:complete